MRVLSMQMIVLKLTICVAYISLRCGNSQGNALRMKATGGLFYAYTMRRIDSRIEKQNRKISDNLNSSEN